jgi:RNA polymerase primary sigma factor
MTLPENLTSERNEVQQAFFLLISSAPQTVTYNQIEDALQSVGLDPFTESEAYDRLISMLEEQEILVVDTLADDAEWVGVEEQALDDADEVLGKLKQIRSNIDEFCHTLLSAREERRLLEIVLDSRRAQNELNNSDVNEIGNKERLALQKRIFAGEEAIELLVRHNLRLVAKIALRYCSWLSHLHFEDLLQEGRIGLMKAIERYNLSLNLRLSTYATWWIRQAITRAIADQDRTIRLPVHMVETVRRIHTTQQRLSIQLGREPTHAELAAALHMPEERLLAILRRSQSLISLELQVGEDKSTLGELLPDRFSPSPLDVLVEQDLRVVLTDILTDLTDRERNVLEMRFGLKGFERHTLEEIGKQFGLTRERIRQIEVKALRKLAGMKRVRSLKADWGIRSGV